MVETHNIDNQRSIKYIWASIWSHFISIQEIYCSYQQLKAWDYWSVKLQHLYHPDMILWFLQFWHSGCLTCNVQPNNQFVATIPSSFTLSYICNFFLPFIRDIYDSPEVIPGKQPTWLPCTTSYDADAIMTSSQPWWKTCSECVMSCKNIVSMLYLQLCWLNGLQFFVVGCLILLMLLSQTTNYCFHKG